MKKYLPAFLILTAALCGVAQARAQTQKRAQMQAPTSAQAQHPTRTHRPRWSFDILTGLALPVGQFANMEQHNPVSGHVQSGSNIELGSTYHLSHRWGITILAGSQYNGSDRATKAIPLTGPTTPDPALAALYAGHHWKMTRLLAGGVYTLPLNKKETLALLGRALAGIQKTETGNYSYLFPPSPDGITEFFYRPGQHLPWTFSYQADAGFQWKPYRRWALLVYSGYNGCQPSYNLDVGKLLAPSAAGGNSDVRKLYFPTGSLLFRAGIEIGL